MNLKKIVKLLINRVTLEVIYLTLEIICIEIISTYLMIIINITIYCRYFSLLTYLKTQFIILYCTVTSRDIFNLFKT